MKRQLLSHFYYCLFVLTYLYMLMSLRPFETIRLFVTTNIIYQQRYTTLHKIQSVWQWYLDNHKDHTRGQSGLHAKVSHHHGLGEQYLLLSLQTVGATLQCSSWHKSPSLPKLLLIALTYHDVCPQCHKAICIQFFAIIKGFFASWLSNGFCASLRIYFTMSQLILQIWGWVT